MPHNFGKMKLLAKTEENDGVLMPTSFILALFNEEPRRRRLLDDEDMENVLGSSIPVRFVDTDDFDFDIVYETSAHDWVDRARSRVARHLLSRFDGLDDCSGSCVPTEIAMLPDNRPAVAMHMFAYQDKSYEEIADLFGVDVDTISRYRRRFRRG